MLVLLDNSMPGISGVDLCKVWRSYEQLAGLDSALVRICMISAAPIPVANVFDEVVVKPIDRKILGHILAPCKETFLSQNFLNGSALYKN